MIGDNMIKFYLNTLLRSKELQVMVQPTSYFIDKVNQNVPVLFMIYPKQHYFQSFMENQNLNINNDNFLPLIDKYYEINQNYESQLINENIIFQKSNSEYELPSFYINKSYIEIEDIVNCCRIYASNIGQDSFEVLIDRDQAIFQNNELLDIDIILNHPENSVISAYIDMREASTIHNKDIVIMFILDKWLHQEMKKHPKSPKHLNDLMIPINNGEHFVFNHILENEIKNETLSNMNLFHYLETLWGKDKGEFLKELIYENPYRRWKY